VQGCGVLQVHSALEYLQKWASLGSLEDVNFDVTVGRCHSTFAITT
jgi:hypothetical protein